MKASSIGLLMGIGLFALAAGAHAEVLTDSVNLADSGDSGAYWGISDVGWLYTPATSYNLSGIATKFSVPNLTSIQDRTVTVVIYQGNTPANGGTLLGSFAFSSTLADNNTLGGGSFATPIALTAGQTYFVGFENVGPMSSTPNQDDLGVNFTADAGATFLSNLYFDTSGNASCNSGTFACEDTNTDILGQPILAFYAPSPTAPVPEPATLAMFGAALAGLGVMRRPKRKPATPS